MQTPALCTVLVSTFVPAFKLQNGILSWTEQSAARKNSPSAAGPCGPILTFGEEPAPHKWDLMLMVAQKKLNCCPNTAHLAVMTNRILFWKRKKMRKSVLITS